MNVLKGSKSKIIKKQLFLCVCVWGGGGGAKNLNI